MMSRRLRGVLVVEFAFLLAMASLAAGGSASTPSIASAAFAALLLLNVGTVSAVYALARLYARAFRPEGSARAARRWRCAAGELLALFAVFVVIQPFERWWMGDEAVGPIAPGRVPLLLVHGYLCNRGMWWWLRRRLRARRFAVATVNLEPPRAGMDRLAERLAERIDALLAETGAGKVVLVTHSMGGLVSRAYLRRRGAARVAALVTLAAPHHGSWIARLGFGRCAREMEPDSEWLRCLNADPAPPIPIDSVWTVEDEMVVPPASSRLPGARETVLDGVGHMAMVLSPRVLEHVAAAASATGACPAATG